MKDCIYNYLIEHGFPTLGIKVLSNQETDEECYDILKMFKNHDYEKIVMLPVFNFYEQGYAFENVDFICDTWDREWESVCFFKSGKYLYVGFIASNTHSKKVRILMVKKLNRYGYDYMHEHNLFDSEKKWTERDIDHIDFLSEDFF